MTITSRSDTDIWQVDIETWGSVAPCSSKETALEFVRLEFARYSATLLSKREYNQGGLVELIYETTILHTPKRIGVSIYKTTLAPHLVKEANQP